MTVSKLLSRPAFQWLVWAFLVAVSLLFQSKNWSWRGLAQDVFWKIGLVGWLIFLIYRDLFLVEKMAGCFIFALLGTGIFVWLIVLPVGSMRGKQIESRWNLDDGHGVERSTNRLGFLDFEEFLDVFEPHLLIFERKIGSFSDWDSNFKLFEKELLPIEILDKKWLVVRSRVGPEPEKNPVYTPYDIEISIREGGSIKKTDSVSPVRRPRISPIFRLDTLPIRR